MRLPEEKVESNGIGIQNIKNMMKKMNGECIVEKEKSGVSNHISVSIC